jgi:dihydrolipoamide dehydrogenase
MQKHSVDVAILGAGTAGLAAYRAAIAKTPNVVLIDGGPLGTTCARVGCMPSKLLIAAAEAAFHSRHSAVFGVQNLQTLVDGKAVMARVQAERDRFVGFVLRSMNEIPAEHKITAYAQFLDNHHLLLDNGDQIEAKSIVIATGSHPFIPAIFHGVGSRLLTNENLFDLPDLPKKMAVFGPGVIGLELGQALHRLGVDVKVFGVSGSFAVIKDPKIKDYALTQFSSEFYLDIHTKILSVTEHSEGVIIEHRNLQGDFVAESFEYLLVATGRRANVNKLALANTNLELNHSGIPIFNEFTLQCGNSNIFIAGDANHEKPLLHEAADEGKIAGNNAAVFPNIKLHKRRAALGIVFTDPQIAQVGMNLDQVKHQHGSCFAVGEVSFEDQGRSRVMAVNKGLLRIYAEQGTGVFLGAEMMGPGAEHMGHLLSWAAQQKMTIAQMLEMPFYHPVIEEGIRTALRDANAKLRIGSVNDCSDAFVVVDS